VINRPVNWAIGKEFLPPFWLVPTAARLIGNEVNMTMSEKTVSMAVHIAAESAGPEIEHVQVRVPCMLNLEFIPKGTLLGQAQTDPKAKSKEPKPRDWMSVKT
jgi:hypothetical protein